MKLSERMRLYRKDVLGFGEEMFLVRESDVQRAATLERRLESAERVHEADTAKLEAVREGLVTERNKLQAIADQRSDALIELKYVTAKLSAIIAKLDEVKP